MMQLRRPWSPPDTSHTPPAGVLVVDDDPLTLDLLGMALPPCGFRAWAAPGPDEALRLLCRQREGHAPRTPRLLGRLSPAVRAAARRGVGRVGHPGRLAGRRGPPGGP